MDSSVKHVGSRSFFRLAAREIWRYFPIWFFAYQAWGTLNISVNNIDPVDPGSLPPLTEATVVFPLFWVFVFYYLRVRRSNIERKGPVFLGIGAVLLIPVLLVYLSPPDPLSVRTLKIFFEISTTLCIIVMGAHAYMVRGRHHFIRIFGIGLAYGLILENGGILMEFFFEEGYYVYIPFSFTPAPVCTLAGWCTVFYSCSFIAEEILPKEKRLNISPVRTAALATVVALFLDAQIDPVATHLTWWTWHPTLTAGTSFFGVPFINYIAWASAVFPFALCLFWLEQRRTWTEEQITQRLAIGLPAIVGVAAGMVLALSLLLTGGYHSPTMLLFRKSIYDTLFFWS